MELLLSKKVGIFKTFLIVIFGEELSRLDERDFGNFYQPKIFLWFFDGQNFEKNISHSWRAESKISINTKDSP